MKKYLLLIYYLIYSLLIHQSITCTVFNSTNSPLFGQLQTQYHLTSSNRDISTTTREDYAILATDIEDNVFSKYPDFQYYPISTFGVIVSYNLPQIDEQICFSRQNLIDIFAGRIAFWNDSRLQEVNPQVALPSERLRIAFRSDDCVENDIILSFLRSVSSEFNETNVLNNCLDVIERTEISSNDVLYVCNTSFNTSLQYFTSGSSQTNFGNVLNNEYTISYQRVDSFVEYEDVKSAKILNRNGDLVEYSYETAIDAVRWKRGQFKEQYDVDLVDLEGRNAYPLIGLNYIGIRKETQEGSCGVRSGLVDFFKWILTSDVAYYTLENEGFYRIPFELATIVDMDIERSIYCLNDVNEMYLATYYDLNINVNAIQKVFNLIHILFNSYIDQTGISNDIMIKNLNNQVEKTWVDLYNNTLDMILTLGNEIPIIDKSLDETNNDLINDWGNNGEENMLKYNGYNQYQEYINLPIGIFNIVPIYQYENEQNLNITLDIISKIYTGEIYEWDDVEIQNINPNIILNNEHINVIMNKQYTPYSCHIIDILSNVNNQFANMYQKRKNIIYNNVNITSCRLYSSEFIYLDKIINDEEILETSIVSNEYSFGLNLLMNDIISSNIMNIIDDNNIYIYNTNEMKGCANNMELSNSIYSIQNHLFSNEMVLFDFNYNISNLNCWPLTIPLKLQFKLNSDSYYNYNTNKTSNEFTQDCNNVLNLNKFTIWLLENNYIEEIINDMNGKIISDNIRLYLSHFLQRFTNCNNNYMLQNEIECTSNDFYSLLSECNSQTLQRKMSYFWNSPKTCVGDTLPDPVKHLHCGYLPFDNAYAIFIMIVAIIGGIFCIFLGYWIHKNRNQRVLKKSNADLLLLFIAGGIAHSLASISYLGENTKINCINRMWTWHLSLTIMITPLYMKLRRVQLLFQASAKMRKKSIRVERVYLWVCIAVGLDAFLNIMVALFDPPEPNTITYYDEGISYEIEKCKLSFNSIFILPFIYKIWQVGFALVISFQAWSISSEFSEAKTMMIAMYNIAIVNILVFLIEIPYDLPALLSSSLVALSSVWISVVSCGLITIPKMIQHRIYKKREVEQGIPDPVISPRKIHPERSRSLQKLPSSLRDWRKANNVVIIKQDSNEEESQSVSAFGERSLGSYGNNSLSALSAPSTVSGRPSNPSLNWSSNYNSSNRSSRRSDNRSDESPRSTLSISGINVDRDSFASKLRGGLTPLQHQLVKSAEQLPPLKLRQNLSKQTSPVDIETKDREETDFGQNDNQINTVLHQTGLDTIASASNSTSTTPTYRSPNSTILGSINQQNNIDHLPSLQESIEELKNDLDPKEDEVEDAEEVKNDKS